MRGCSCETSTMCLQSNAIAQRRAGEIKEKQDDLTKLQRVKTYAERAGLKWKAIDKLPIIHVAGTKGKGSTCAFAEVLLRHSSNLRTGLFTSPHLVSVRERIRINAEPISEELFTKYFHEVYTKLKKSIPECQSSMPSFDENAQSSPPRPMPPYFCFLTIMALHAFIEEKVDVAIIEVGIGGWLDSTNIIRRPLVTGISSLGFDHVKILGNTIEQIAWQKSGIFKPNIPAISVNQKPEALQVIRDRALELKVLGSRPIFLHNDNDDFGISKVFSHTLTREKMENASLALALTRVFHVIKMYQNDNDDDDDDFSTTSYPDLSLIEQSIFSSAITTTEMNAMAKCYWPGRQQLLTRGRTNFFLDGAHTPESIPACVGWFQKYLSEKQRMSLSSVKCIRLLLFNAIGPRDVEPLLSPLVELNSIIPFDYVIFLPNVTFLEDFQNPAASNTSFSSSYGDQLERCRKHYEMWQSLVQLTNRSTSVPQQHYAESAQSSMILPNFVNFTDVVDDCNSSNTFIARSISDSLEFIRSLSRGCSNADRSPRITINSMEKQFSEKNFWIKNRSSSPMIPSSSHHLSSFGHINNDNNIGDNDLPVSVNVLVTGSLHLVGCVLSLIDPDLKARNF